MRELGVVPGLFRIYLIPGFSDFLWRFQYHKATVVSIKANQPRVIITSIGNVRPVVKENTKWCSGESDPRLIRPGQGYLRHRSE
jgi:hypothetical protein